MWWPSATTTANMADIGDVRRADQAGVAGYWRVAEWPRLMSMAIPSIDSPLLGGTSAQLTVHVAADIPGRRRWSSEQAASEIGGHHGVRLLRLAALLGCGPFR